MDTAKLELAARRHRDAEEALAAARKDLEEEAAKVLQENGRSAQPEVSRLTGWSRMTLRRLARRVNSQADGQV